MDEEYIEPVEMAEEEFTPEPAIPETVGRLLEIAKTEGDISHLLADDKLNAIGSRVVEDYERDDTDRKSWKDKVEKALDRAAQEDAGEKSYPWEKASNVSYPMLTVAALQFAARAYPAIVKNDEAVLVKVFGSNAPPPGLPPEMMQAFSQRHQAKKRRAKRVGDYLNYKLFYAVEDWEGDTDALLHQLPIVGCAFRKVYYDSDNGEPCATYVPALRLVVPQSAKSLDTAPRITEELPDVYPYQIEGRIRAGVYRDVVLPASGDDDQAPRLLLEQHRMEDLDGDGLEEPYVVTVDKETTKVLRIEAAFSAAGVRMNGDRVVGFDRWMPYTKYEFIPDLKGRFYSIGFGHLLDQLTEVVNTSINQLIDAGHAQIAGGGFISSGLRLQGSGQTSTLRWRPGEYKVVNSPPGQLQASIYERTFPNPSPVAFQLLDLMLGAARDITSTKDVITGEANSNAPVGTTLALIEQGLQVFSSIYKRVFRALRVEFRELYECVAKYGDPEDYLQVVDDPEADFGADFAPEGKDISPVSDPSTATKMQAMGKAQMLLGMTGRGLNDQAIYMRAFRAFDVDDPEELMPQQAPQPSPKDIADVEKTASEARANDAKTQKTQAETAEIAVRSLVPLTPVLGGVPQLDGAPADAMGVPSDPGGFGGPEGGMGPGFVGGG